VGDSVACEQLRDCTSGRGIGKAIDRAEAPTGGPHAASATSTTGPAHVYAVQPLYVLPRDGIDNGLAAKGTIDRSVAAMQKWFGEQTGGCRLRFLAGPPATVRLGQTDAQIASAHDHVRDLVEELLRARGYDNPNRIYAVWYDGTSTYSCGGGAWPPTLMGHVAALYLQGRYDNVDCSRDEYSSDGVKPEINEFKMLHEILHTLGFVARRAPHHTRKGHVSDDPTDLMYAGPTGPPYWQPSVLDVGHDDYYMTGRTDLPDLSRSVFLDPLPPHPMPPPGWP